MLLFIPSHEWAARRSEARGAADSFASMSARSICCCTASADGRHPRMSARTSKGNPANDRASGAIGSGDEPAGRGWSRPKGRPHAKAAVLRLRCL